MQPRNILDLGAGTGNLNPLLRKRYPVAQIVALDFSARMLLHNRKINSSKQLRPVCADAEKLPFSSHSFDLIISNLMLPWCLDLPIIFTEVHRVLKPGGLFLFSTLGVDTLNEVHTCWSVVDDTPHVHPCYDLHDMGDVLLQTGFADPVLDKEVITLFYKNIHCLSDDLKATGTHNLLQERRKYLTGKNRWHHFAQQYEAYRDSKGNIPATFEVVYGHAWRSNTWSSTAEHPGEVRIPLDQIVRNYS